MELFELKSKVYSYCVELVEQKIMNLENQIQLNKQAANEETKSSMGDKYETGRAMAQLERDKLTAQLGENGKLKKVLSQLSSSKIEDQIQIGCLVETSGPLFYLAISLGAVKVESRDILAISPVAPIGKELLGKKVGDEILFMKKQIKIVSIC